MTTKAPIIPLKGVFPRKLKKEISPTCIAIPLKNEIRVVAFNDILFLKSDSNYTEIHLEDGSKIVASSTLKNYQAKLNTHYFIRVHNSYIIQKSQIASFLYSESKIILRNAQEIPVSRSKKERLLTYLKSLTV